MCIQLVNGKPINNLMCLEQAMQVSRFLLYVARSGSNLPDLRTSGKEIHDPNVKRELDDVKTMQHLFCNPARAYRLIRYSAANVTMYMYRTLGTYATCRKKILSAKYKISSTRNRN